MSPSTHSLRSFAQDPWRYGERSRTMSPSTHMLRSFARGDILSEVEGEDYFSGAAADALVGSFGVSADSSLAGPLRDFTLICLIFGRPKTDRPSFHSPLSMSHRTRS